MNDAERFLAEYDPRAYAPVAVTVDVVALTIRDAKLQVLLIRRAEQPFAGAWALPGGFVRPRPAQNNAQNNAQNSGEQWEDLMVTATRVLTEEAVPDLRAAYLEQLGTYGDPVRDPRMRVISVAWLAFAPQLPEAAAGLRAADAQWVPVSSIGQRAGEQQSGITQSLAFDHARILSDALDRARAKLEYTPLATAFLAEPFTMKELREVYETVWGEPLHAANFHRKVLSVPGFVESTGEQTETGGSRGGPRARLYRRGDAKLLHPALLRPATEAATRP